MNCYTTDEHFFARGSSGSIPSVYIPSDNNIHAAVSGGTIPPETAVFIVTETGQFRMMLRVRQQLRHGRLITAARTSCTGRIELERPGRRCSLSASPAAPEFAGTLISLRFILLRLYS